MYCEKEENKIAQRLNSNDDEKWWGAYLMPAEHKQNEP